MPSHAHTYLPSETKAEAKLCSVPEVLSIINNAVLCGHGHVGLKNEIKEEPCSSEDMELQHELNNAFCDEDSTKEYSDDLAQEVYEPYTSQSVFPKEEPVIDSAETQNVVLSSSEGSDDDLDCEVLKCHEEMPELDEATEHPPVQYRSEIKIEALWQHVHACVSAVTSAILNRDKEKLDAVSTKQMQEETSDIVEIQDELLLDCPLCDFSDKSQKKCVRHIADKHLEYRYKCKICAKEFRNFHTKYRHENEHKPPTKFCGVCGKGYYFQSELNKHVAVHSEVLPYRCPSCGKHFAQAKSLSRHQELHSNKTVVCSQCDKVCASQDRYYSHYRGAHGKGYTAKCGKHYEWPAARARHQENCDACTDIIAKEQIAKEKRKTFKTVSGTVLKKLKTEHVEDSLIATKQQVQQKIENILDLKKNL